MQPLPEHQYRRLQGQLVCVGAVLVGLLWGAFALLHGIAALFKHRLRWEWLGLATPVVGIAALVPAAALQVWYAPCLWVPVREGAFLNKGNCFFHAWALAGVCFTRFFCDRGINVGL